MLMEGIAGLADEQAPVCVVGSGPVGLSLAADLARRGVDVLLLESGAREARPEVQALSDAHIVDPARHDSMAIAVARRLGGTSHLWGGRCLPFDPVDFDPRSWVDARWPIAFSDLAPYWPRAIAATSAGEAVFEADEVLWPEADGTFSADTLERWVNIQSSGDVFRDLIREDPRLRVRTLCSLAGMHFAEDGKLLSIELAHSLSGERVRLPVRHLVLATGGLETARLLLHAAKESDRFGAREGALGRYYMGHVYGEIADIVFDRPEASAAFDFQVDRHGSYMRRRLVASRETQRDHRLLNAAFWPVVPPVADPRHRNAILSMVYCALRSPVLGDRLVAEAIRRRHLPDDPGPIWPHIANIARGLPQAAGFAAAFLRKRYFSGHRLPGFFLRNAAQRYGLSYHGEQVPMRDSRVWLGEDRDALGLPRLVIDLRFSVQDARSVVEGHDLLDDWLVRNRIGRLHYRMDREMREAAILSQATHGTHQVGVARMGDNRREAVVDASLTCFDAPNLHLAGAAVLPTSGQANPSLTAIALGLRLGDHIRETVMRQAGL